MKRATTLVDPNKDTTVPIRDSSAMYNVYLKLSERSSGEWQHFFDQKRKVARTSMHRSA